MAGIGNTVETDLVGETVEVYQDWDNPGLRSHLACMARTAHGFESFASDSPVTVDMRLLKPGPNESLFYGAEPSVSRNGTLIKRPMEWFIPDLEQYAKAIHDQIAVCWDRDVAEPCAQAVGVHVFSGAGDWRGRWTLLRMHMLGSHGFQYMTVCFSADPVPHWWLGGCRDIVVWKPDYRSLGGGGEMAPDEGYARSWEHT